MRVVSGSVVAALVAGPRSFAATAPIHGCFVEERALIGTPAWRIWQG